MDEPLFTEGLADFMVVHFNDMDRWSQGDIYMHMDEAQRIEKFNEITRMEWAKPKVKAKSERNTLFMDCFAGYGTSKGEEYEPSGLRFSKRFRERRLIFSLTEFHQ